MGMLRHTNILRLYETFDTTKCMYLIRAPRLDLARLDLTWLYETFDTAKCMYLIRAPRLDLAWLDSSRPSASDRARGVA